MPQRIKIAHWLLALSVLGLAPLLVFSLFAVSEFAEAQRRALRGELIERTDAMAADVRVLLSTAVGGLGVLATSDAAKHGDIPTLYAHATRVVAELPGARAISLVAPDRRIIFLTLRPLGTQGLQGSDLESLDHVFSTGRPAVSGPFKAPISDRLVFTVGVPVIQNGKVAYCLRMVFLASSLGDLLAAQHLPDGWRAAVVDQHGLLVGRSVPAAHAVGDRAAPAVMARLARHQPGIFEVTAADGTPVTTYLRNVPGWTWSVLIGVPSSAFNAPLHRSMGFILGAGAFSLLFAALLSQWAARRLTRQVSRLLKASRAVTPGQARRASGVTIAEFQDLERALLAMEAEARLRHEEAVGLSTKSASLSLELERARRDVLTGLPGRAMFREAVDAIRSSLGEELTQGLACLYIDLDGFKAANDRLGHAAGDDILVRVARILKSLIRDQDVAARLGGDEFAVCVLAADDALVNTARNIAARLIEQVAAIGMGIGCSVGICVWSARCRNIDDVIACADEAMYEAKRRGKNQFVTYGDEARSDGQPWSALARSA